MRKLLILSVMDKNKVLSTLGPSLQTQVEFDAVTLEEHPIHLVGGSNSVYLALGEPIREAFMGLGAIGKSKKITALRSIPVKFGSSDILFSYSPGIAVADYSKYIDLLCDCRGAIRLAETGNIEPDVGEYRYVPDFRDLIQAIEAEYAQTGRPVELAGDTETTGFDYVRPEGYIVMVQLSIASGTADAVYFPNQMAQYRARDGLIGHQLNWLLNSPKVSFRGANGKFDMLWFRWKFGLTCSNFKFDTTIVGSLLDENRSNALDVHGKIYTSMGGYSDKFDKEVDKSHMELVEPAKLLQYGGGDADCTLRVSKAIKPLLLQDGQLTNFYVTLLHPAARAFEKVESVGMLVDMNAYAEVENALVKKMNECIATAKKHLGGILVARHYDGSKIGGLNITKPSLLKEFLFTKEFCGLTPNSFTEKAKAETAEYASTGMDELAQYEDHPKAGPFISVLSEFSSANKMLSTYVHGFQEHLRADGRYHPSYFMFAGNKDEGEGGTNTGRLSARDPPAQTIPKHNVWAKALRRCFVAPPGYLIGEFDFSQGELKIAACVAGEQSMIQAYLDGLDLHVVTSAGVAGYTYDQMMEFSHSSDPKMVELYEATRQLGKAGNFGLLYGMGVEGFMEYARKNYGVKLTYHQAETFRNGFLQKYPGLVEYHKAYKKFAKQNAYVRSPLGRLRHLPLINSPARDVASKAERQAINSPIQGCLSDMLIWSCALWDKQGMQEVAPVFCTIHDAAYLYLPENHAEEIAYQFINVMENLPLGDLGWKPQLKFTADGKIGPNMADLKKLKKAA